MTKLKRYPQLWLILTAFTVMFCRVIGCSDPQTITMHEGNVSTSFICTNYTDFATGSDKGMVQGVTCNIPCPDGSKSKVDLPDVPSPNFLNSHTTSEIQAMYCTGGAAPAPTEAPTEEPTEEPTEASAPPTEAPTDPAPLKPYLTGAFTTCDNVAGYVNFTIAEDAPAYDPATFKVTFNGYPVNCAPAPNNPKILTCNYPPVSYQPPAGVQVFIGEELVNEFDFNGGEICNPAPQPNTDNTEEEQPAPTEAPTEVDPGGNG